MGFKFNPLTGQLDIDNDVGSSGEFVQRIGDEMSGDLEFTADDIGTIYEDSDGMRWRVTADPDGALRTSLVVDGNGSTGQPMGLLLALTYP